LQITRTTPLRRMILQLRHIRFTDAITFISSSLAISNQLSAKSRCFSALPGELTADG